MDSILTKNLTTYTVQNIALACNMFENMESDNPNGKLRPLRQSEVWEVF